MLNRRQLLVGAGVTAAVIATPVILQAAPVDSNAAIKARMSDVLQQMTFEFNDDVTRAAVQDLMEPFLRDIQSSGAIADYRVVCDQSNNLPEVIDQNQLVLDVYIKHDKSLSDFTKLTAINSVSGVELQYAKMRTII